MMLLACLLGSACAKHKPPAELAALETRVAYLEETLAKREEALKFLDMAYEARLDQETRPAPGTVYGVDIAQNLALGQVIGPPDALVTIVKAWDFACPHCYRSSLILDELLDEYQGKVRLVLKHMVVHPQQVAAAHLAACAAAKQGKFREFYKAFWTDGYQAYADRRDESLLGPDNVLKIASGVGLDANRLQADMPSCQQVIAADEAELRKFKVGGTPAFFINGEYIGGGIPKATFKQYIDRKLDIAARSGVPGADYYAKEIRGKGEQSVQRPGTKPASPPAGGSR